MPINELKNGHLALFVYLAASGLRLFVSARGLNTGTRAVERTGIVAPRHVES